MSLAMRNERALELISAAADGALNDGEGAELERLLEDSPEARRAHAELERLESILADAAAETPPEALRNRILANVALPAARSRKPVFASMLRYGLATAAGLVLAAVFYETQPRFGGAPDIAKLVGTMAPHPAGTVADVLDRYTFRMDGFDGQVLLERRDGALLLDIQVDAARPLDISVNFAASDTRLVALAQVEKPLESIQIADQTLRLRVLGRRQLTALLEHADDTAFAGEAKIELEFSSNGKLLRRGLLTPAG